MQGSGRLQPCALCILGLLSERKGNIGMVEEQGWNTGMLENHPSTQLHNPKCETLPKVIPDTSTPDETLQSFPRAVMELPRSLSKASWQNPKSQPGNLLPWPVGSSGSPKAKGTAVGLCCLRELTGMLIRVQFGAKLSFPISPLLHGVEMEDLGLPVFVWVHTGPHQLLLYQNNLHWAWM